MSNPMSDVTSTQLSPNLPGPKRSRRFGLNPVFARELRERSRKNGTPVVLTIYLLLLVLVAGLAYQSGNPSNEFGTFRGVVAGRQMFEWVVFTLFALISFFVPGYTAGGITGERERQTLVPLQVTLLRPRQIVVGKLLASIAYTVLLIIAASPILAFAYSIGGVTIRQVVSSIVALVFIAFVHAAIAVFWSAMFRRSVAAIVMSYFVVLALTIGTGLLWGLLAVLSRGGANDGSWTMAANPIVFLADFVTPNTSAEALFGGSGVLSGIAEGSRRSFDWFGPNWLVPGSFLGLLALAALVVASQRLRLPANRER